MKSAQPFQRSIRAIVMPAQYRDGNTVSITSYFLTGYFDCYKPSCFAEAQGVNNDRMP